MVLTQFYVAGPPTHTIGPSPRPARSSGGTISWWLPRTFISQWRSSGVAWGVFVALLAARDARAGREARAAAARLCEKRLGRPLLDDDSSLQPEEEALDDVVVGWSAAT